jgi:hypothetical protein
MFAGNPSAFEGKNGGEKWCTKGSAASELKN